MPILNRVIQGQEYTDATDPEKINNFVYETIFLSSFSQKEYRYEYTPVEVTAMNKSYETKFIVYLENDVIIEYSIFVYCNSFFQKVSINLVTINKGDYSYSFKP